MYLALFIYFISALNVLNVVSTTEPYTYKSCSDPFNDISTNIGSGATQFNANDDSIMSTSLGFSFTFYGASYSTAYLSSNGFMSFDALLNSNCCAPDSIPDPVPPNNWILMYQEDMDPANKNGNEAVVFQTLGNAPNRQFIYQFTNIPEFPNYGANTFQAVLYETTNIIQLRYGTLNPYNTGSNGDVPSIGIENADGTDGISIDASTVSAGTCIEFNPPATCFDTTNNNPCTVENRAARNFYHTACESCCHFIQCGEHTDIAYKMPCAGGTYWVPHLLTCDHNVGQCSDVGCSLSPIAANSVKTHINSNDKPLLQHVADTKVENKTNGYNYYGYILLIGVIAFILVNNVFIGCFCLNKNKNKQYAKCDMIVNDMNEI